MNHAGLEPATTGLKAAPECSILKCRILSEILVL